MLNKKDIKLYLVMGILSFILYFYYVTILYTEY